MVCCSLSLRICSSPWRDAVTKTGGVFHSGKVAGQKLQSKNRGRVGGFGHGSASATRHAERACLCGLKCCLTVGSQQVQGLSLFFWQWAEILAKGKRKTELEKIKVKDRGCFGTCAMW